MLRHLPGMLLGLLIATTASAKDIYVNCTNLIDGNFTKNSRETVSELAFSLFIDTSAGEVSFRGILVKDDGYKKNFSSDLSKGSKFQVVGSLIESSTHFREYTECGKFGKDICHIWKSFSYDTNTNIGTYNEAEALRLISPSQEVRLSMRFSCH